ncbi:pheromone A receptor-domain-containing protein [Fomitopsis serialis]|uniref:pheromone A receptor-domain-containing protein n=1 Tax=Fomitopsis serialis TaxID=139415 RepID=UPI0020077A22|nr:pheromone A receptor-domain-containing protein [Neoantrodia serialis]KAH9919597.1 pheromone A receptor-domain-containing protein [Neoantrodia serialis]
MGDTTYPLFPIFAFLGFVVGLIPIPWHLQGWNAGTCLYMIWVSLASLVVFVDSIVWNGSVSDPAPIWCDISTKFLIGAGVGIPASSLCINRRLYRISSMTTATITRNEKRRAVLEDMAIAIGIPVLVMILHVIVQGHRYNIFEDVGCMPDIWNTPPAYPLVFMWPVVLGCVSFVYASLTLRAFWRRRAEFSQLLSSSSALTRSRYFRLMLLCCVEMACTIPLGVFSIVINNGDVPVAPYVSWANAHYDFSYVGKFPALAWMFSRPFYISVEMGRWIYPCSAFLFFSLFGFAEEARRNYKLAFRAIAKRLGFELSSGKARTSPFKAFRLGSNKESPSPSEETLPPYSPRKSKRPQRPRSFSSSFLDSVIEIDVDYDIEKAAESLSSTTVYGTDKPADSPAATSATLSFPESAMTATPKAPSGRFKFAAAPPLSPETPSYPLTVSTVVPRYHKPFASIGDPASPSTIAAKSAAIQVTMHREVTEVAESS